MTNAPLVTPSRYVGISNFLLFDFSVNYDEYSEMLNMYVEIATEY